MCEDFPTALLAVWVLGWLVQLEKVKAHLDIQHAMDCFGDGEADLNTEKRHAPCLVLLDVPQIPCATFGQAFRRFLKRM